MKTILGKILHGCQDVSMLIVRSSDTELSLSEKVLLHSHLLFCKCCKNFIKESTAIDKSLEVYFKEMETAPRHTLSDDFKFALAKKLAE
jgi:hypothetical protein